MRHITQNKHNKRKTRFGGLASYDDRPGKGAGLSWKVRDS